MANPEHLAMLYLLKEDIKAWNEWRNRSRGVDVSLSRADLSNANLSNADLSNADLSKSNLRGALLSRTNLYRANLIDAILDCANLTGAELVGTQLINANLREADLSRAQLRWANLRGANLTKTNLSNTDFTSASLEGADLSDCAATGMKLWETQRAYWKIKGIVCEHAFWDENAEEKSEYAPGEFERLYSDQPRIELFYQGGVSAFELNTFPALLQHLVSLHPDTNIRLKSIEETGGGAKISISVADADAATTEKIKADAMQVYRAQLALRDKETERLRIERDYIETLFIGKLIPAMLSAGTSQNVFNAPVTGLVISSGESKVDFHPTINDNSALLTLLEKIMDRHADLGLSSEDALKLDTELQSATTELQRPNPNRSIASKSLEIIEKVLTGALGSFAGGLSENAVLANWQTWADQLSQFIQHFR